MTYKEKIIEIQKKLGVTPDGDFGPKSKAAYDSLDGGDIVREIQIIIGFIGKNVDGFKGPMTNSALRELAALAKEDKGSEVIYGKASSFADLADVRAFKECKAKGKSDQECFKVGDNAIGKWGVSTASETVPMCALPRGTWAHLKNPNGTLVSVTIKGKTVICELRDTLPAKPKHGVVIDLNPGAQNAFNLKPPFLVDCSWRWV